MSVFIGLQIRIVQIVYCKLHETENCKSHEAERGLLLFR